MISLLTIGSTNFNTGNNFFISELPGLEMPPIRMVNYNLAGEHFGLYVSAFYGKRRFSIKGWVIGSSQADFQTKRDQLQNDLDITKGEIPIYLTLVNGRQLRIDAILVALDFSPKPGELIATQFNASFEASFPFLVSQTENSQNFSLATGGGGKVPPDTMPMALSTNSGGSIFVVNNGNAPYYPNARITGPVLNPSLRNNTTGKVIRFAINLASTDYLDIDFKRKTVIDNQGRNQYSTKSGDWWLLGAGTSEIRFLADNYDPNALTLFKYKDSFLGI
jgi:hypothetical protein